MQARIVSIEHQKIPSFTATPPPASSIAGRQGSSQKTHAGRSQWKKWGPNHAVYPQYGLARNINRATHRPKQMSFADLGAKHGPLLAFHRNPHVAPVREKSRFAGAGPGAGAKKLRSSLALARRISLPATSSNHLGKNLPADVDFCIPTPSS